MLTFRRSSGEMKWSASAAALSVVLHRSCSGPGEIVVAAAIRERTEVLGQFLGARQGVTDQRREALPQRVMEALEVMGFPGVLRHRRVALRRHHTRLGGIVIRVARGWLTVHHRDLRPHLFGPLTTAGPDVQGDDLAGPGCHGAPEPPLVRLRPDNAPPLIGFSCQLPHDDSCRADE
jgi:hypothetical protein